MVNGDPYRSASQSSDRRVINRSGSGAAPRSSAEYEANEQYAPAQAVQSTAGASSRASRVESQPKSGAKWPLWMVIVILAVALAGVLAWTFIGKSGAGATGIDMGRYQAVFLINGQIYFGKMSNFSDTSYKLTNIYYPQAETTTDEEGATATDTSGGIQLIKLGEEVHGPEDTMFISKDQILYYENLREDSRVSQLIEQNK
ncbi:hypothetical protein B7Z17_02520 [Candidatus Saccharibacteria bacterium 32-49-10]|nr:MAG: hypothetical protein B7Z17_02520 [Candidatus Saccharibacteria bacterium 32-49-10]